MLLDYYGEFKKYFIVNSIANYGARPTRFIGGDEKSIRNIVGFKKLDKGCEVWVEGGKYPIRTHSIGSKVAIIAQTKRLLPLLTRTTKRKIFFLLNFDCIIDWLHYYLSDAYLEENFYSQPVRELYRLLQGQMRDIVCSILEYDTAYRYRLQDILYLVNKESFEKSPYREMKRLINILIEREVYDDMKNKWKRMRSILWAIHFNRKLLRELKRIIREINLEEIKSSVEDLYWEAMYEDYNFNGLTFEERSKQREAL